MKLLRQLCIIVIICFIGSFLSTILKLPIPGNVLGLIILLVCLCTGVIKLDKIDLISKFLLDHLAFFFLPAGVGLIASYGIIKNTWPILLIICFISTIVIMAVTSLVVTILRRKGADSK
ncbi:putative effector of murein hydrolase LrgA [Clostridium pasteurianum DSM 525 = ATCC 6013]|uniref:LrgA family protein n=1 Tax=Clostridium pasteurianum DSM 525 = ATCC 6013 TaxID=1262449 RepID=A0A0H3J0N2_CLOPA|nr:CidA/LrgA family protein [Clostridium pasteurianum]AJA46227.1 putative effector of murein hydrolase LrgA [Clostridium pasteurianum DSM 525 = ATCC 6013]AJA50215.1 putative effector of murein hydrolase LrgA [Clostridium pasteurianum DSM 525 = ATCC 6013]AOZ73683.1 murein hydrolase transporter LrgA [Clostridium pasteurianum DSM 525 = ATCC 6013]AOZ77480.1 murein hydrolase transporter LrgA [Clostridium pasteurianum]ELP60812.1 putative effector of murein hydrolase LrgA [Clostridium pasteurianum DS